MDDLHTHGTHMHVVYMLGNPFILVGHLTGSKEAHALISTLPIFLAWCIWGAFNNEWLHKCDRYLAHVHMSHWYECSLKPAVAAPEAY